MNLINMAVDIFSVLVLLILEYVQLKKGKKDEVVRKFSNCLYWVLISLLADIGNCVYRDFFPNRLDTVLFRMFQAVTYAGAFPVGATLFRYYGVIAGVKDGIKNKVITFFQITLYIMGILFFVLGFTNQIFVVQDNRPVPGPAYSYSSLVYLLMLVAGIIVLVMIRSMVDKTVFSSLRLGLIFMTVSALMSAINIDAGFAYPTFALALLIMYVCIQSALIQLSQVKTSQMALNQAKEVNKLLQKSYQELEENHRSIDAISSMFSSVYQLDLVNNTYKELTSNSKIRSLVDAGDINTPLQQRIWYVMTELSGESNKDAALAFTNLFSLEERMKGRNYISLDIKSDLEDDWRFIFIRVGKSTEHLTQAIYAAQKLE